MTYEEFFSRREELMAELEAALAASLGKQAAKRLVAASEDAAVKALKAIAPEDGARIARALDELAAQARNVAVDTATERARAALEARAKYARALERLSARFSTKGDKVSIHLLGNTYTFEINGDKLTLIPKKPRGAKGPRRRK